MALNSLHSFDITFLKFQIGYAGFKLNFFCHIWPQLTNSTELNWTSVDSQGPLVALISLPVRPSDAKLEYWRKSNFKASLPLLDTLYEHFDIFNITLKLGDSFIGELQIVLSYSLCIIGASYQITIQHWTDTASTRLSLAKLSSSKLNQDSYIFLSYGHLF